MGRCMIDCLNSQLLIQNLSFAVYMIIDGTFGKVIQNIACASTSNIYNVIYLSMYIVYTYIVFKLRQGLVTFTLPLHTYGFIYVTDRIFCILYIYIHSRLPRPELRWDDFVIYLILCIRVKIY